MLITVVGTSGLGRVAGVPSASPAALLKVVAGRPDQQVVVLTPEHTAAAARRQADLVAAARPTAQVQVVASSHHALTLTLVADRIVASAAWPAGLEVFLARVQAELAGARSLVWSPSAWRLRGASVGVVPRLRSLAGGPGAFLELGPQPRLGTAHDGWRPRTGDQLHTLGRVPTLLAQQLAGHHRRPVDTEVERAPYAPRSAQLLTALPPTSVSSRPIERPDTPDTQESEAA